MIFGNPFHAEADAPVVEQQVGARLQDRVDFRMRQTDAAAVAGGGVEIQPKRLARCQIDPALPEAANPQLGALQVGDDGDRTPERRLDVADRAVTLGVLLVRAVGEVQAEGVRARLVQRAHPLGPRAGRAEGRQDLGGTITVHGGAIG